VGDASGTYAALFRALCHILFPSTINFNSLSEIVQTVQRSETVCKFWSALRALSVEVLPAILAVPLSDLLIGAVAGS
jgi:hypothetical protein